MSGVRDILNHGVRIGGRSVAAASIPESPPTLSTDGFPVVATLASNITITPPFIQCLCDIEGGVRPLAEVHAYAYYPDATELLSSWQRVRTAIITDDILTYIPIPTIGARRFQVIVAGVEGSPTSVRLSFRGISKEASDLIHVIEGELRPREGAGSYFTVAGTSTRIGPLAIDRAYQIFTDAITWWAIGDSSVVATKIDFPMQAGPVYEYTPRSSAEQYAAFLNHSTDATVYYGRAN